MLLNLTKRAARIAAAAAFIGGLAATTMPTISFAQELQTVRLSMAGVVIFRLPLYIALHNGYFKDNGLNVEVVTTRGGSDAMKLLAAGSVEFSTGQVVDAVNLNVQDIHVRGIFMMTSRYTNSLLVRDDLADEVKSLADLKGRPLGVTSVGSGTWQLAMFIANDEGINPDDLNIVGVGVGANVIGAVKSDRVAVMSYAEPETLQLVKDGDAKMLVDMGDPATHERLVGKDYVNNWIMVLDSYAESNPETVQKFVDAMQDALNWLKDKSPEEVATTLQQISGFDAIDKDVLTEAISRQGIPESGVVTESAFESALSVPRRVGVLKRDMTLDELTINKFAEAAAQ